MIKESWTIDELGQYIDLYFPHVLYALKISSVSLWTDESFTNKSLTVFNTSVMK